MLYMTVSCYWYRYTGKNMAFIMVVHNIIVLQCITPCYTIKDM